jgi:hypothetical protein
MATATDDVMTGTKKIARKTVIPGRREFIASASSRLRPIPAGTVPRT